jgi:hypothetical protein
MSTAAVTPNIQGLPPGATLKPIEGLPPGAELRSIGAPPAAEAPAAPQGGLSSFGEASGLTGLKNLFTHPGDTLSKIPGGLIDEAGRVGSQLKEAWNTPSSEPMKVADRTLYAIPFLGSSLKKADEQYAAGNTRGSIGTGLGAIANVATLGAGSGAAVDAIPSAARAGEGFESLKSDLANQPVVLRSSLKPLQEVAEHAEAGSELPGPANKLLIRSQAIEPMTYPEARRLQENLGSYVREQGVTGSMGGALKQLQKTLYQDIHDAADEVGRGDDYDSAMKEFRQASGLKDSLKVAGKLALKGAGMYGGYSALKDLTGK